jgi:hypothetical protein
MRGECEKATETIVFFKVKRVRVTIVPSSRLGNKRSTADREKRDRTRHHSYELHFKDCGD